MDHGMNLAGFAGICEVSEADELKHLLPLENLAGKRVGTTTLFPT